MKTKLGKVTIVDNTQRKFGSKAFYHACFLEIEGVKKPLLFTTDELDVAISRAKTNLEDLPKLRKSFIQWFLDWFE